MIDRLICSRLWGALVVLFAAAGFSAVCALALANPAGAALPSNCSKAGSRVTCTFSFSGSEQAFRVPQGVGSVRVVAVGASGGGGVGVEPGGAGAVVSGTLSVSGGESLYVEVGGAGGQAGRGGTPGFNGGGTGNGDAGGGGGASDVRTAPRSAGLSPDRRV
ncbi:MAG: hypothetical protein JOY58_01160, partial [Solirubrobacterales bacterium]|nr:hypothetical protein [Solirubrobacterales bacterium]